MCTLIDPFDTLHTIWSDPLRLHPAPRGASACSSAIPTRIRSYVDEKNDKSLLAYIKNTLEKEDFVFWWDRNINAGDIWNDEIRKALRAADIALVLVSQPFLNSKYGMDVEVQGFVRQRKAAKMVAFPVIISPCDWKSHEWLKSTQFEPPDGGTIERHYDRRGKRHGLYLRILQQLREIGRRIREPRP